MGVGSKYQKKNPIDEEANRRDKLKRVAEQPHFINDTSNMVLSNWVIAIDNFLIEGGLTPRGHDEQNSTTTTTTCSLFRVPANMRDVEPAAYCPKLVSIGPFHAADDKLEAMEQHKMRLLLKMLARIRDQNKAVDQNNIMEMFKQKVPDQLQHSTKIGELVEEMKRMEEETRRCYSEPFEEVPSHDFVLMMLLDGCFVIELLRLYNMSFEGKSVNDPIFEARWMLPILQHDLFMLENQLPLFVLDKLFELTSTDKNEPTLKDENEPTFTKKNDPTLTERTLKCFNTLLPKPTLTTKNEPTLMKKNEPTLMKKNEPTLTELTLKFFDALLPREMKKLEKKYEMGSCHDHLLGLFRKSFTLPFQNKESETTPKVLVDDVTPVQERRLVHAVTELIESGVKFKKRQDCDLLEISFTKGVFQIPPLIVDDYTIPLFLNLVAYEQCCPFRDPYFTDYVLFFDSLVNSPKDIEILHYEGIIEHVLGSDEMVANLFNKLSREVVYDVQGCYLSALLKEVNNHTERKWNIWRAKLMHDYFNGPWAFLSLFAAIILLFLTVAQTLFAFLSYINPPTP